MIEPVAVTLVWLLAAPEWRAATEPRPHNRPHNYYYDSLSFTRKLPLVKATTRNWRTEMETFGRPHDCTSHGYNCPTSLPLAAQPGSYGIAI